MHTAPKMKIISNNGLFEIICGERVKKDDDIPVNICMEQIANDIVKNEQADNCSVYYSYTNSILTICTGKLDKNNGEIPKNAQLKCIIVEEYEFEKIEVHKFYGLDEKIYYKNLVGNSNELIKNTHREWTGILVVENLLI